MEHNKVKNPNWQETNQLTMLQAWQRIWTQNYQEQIQLVVRAGLELMASGLQVHHPNCWATKNEWENCMGLYNDEPMAWAMVPQALLLQFSGKLPTYLSPNSKLTFASHLGQNFGLGEGQVGSFPKTLVDLQHLPTRWPQP